MTPRRGMIKDPGGQAMTHTVKLTNRTYEALCVEQQPRETFSETVGRMIGYYKQWQGETPSPGRGEC